MAAWSGNLELVRWLRGEGCDWHADTCSSAVQGGHVEVLRWVRENGAPWAAATRDKAAAELGYTDDLGNLLHFATGIPSDDEYGDVYNYSDIE